MTKEQREALRIEYAKVWHKDSRMIDFCTKEAAEMAELPGGEIITIDRQKIKTDICFGESGYDMKDALAAADHARSSADYFKAQNMKFFTEWLDDLSGSLTREGRFCLVIYTGGKYIRQTADCKLRGFGLVTWRDIIDACGGSCDVEKLTGKQITVRCQPCRIATREEHEIIIKAYEAAAKAHEKRVDTYLKRYGTSKVHAWTYWRDA